jgi:cysteinyl-tRNA synthetase
MIAESLGTTIDIHGGGQDLQFPHHENELAQSTCAHDGAPLARIWMHNGFLNMGGSDKMSKSLGNIRTVPELLAEGWSGDVLRLALLSAQYRQPLEWTGSLLEQMKTLLTRWQGRSAAPGQVPAEVVEALADDLNTPRVFEVLSRLDGPDLGAALALIGVSPTRAAENDPAIDALVAARTAARAAKNWAESDRLRDELAAQGIVLEDGAAGTTWRRG